MREPPTSPGEPGAASCPTPSRILRLLLHELPDEAAQQLESHIDSCPPCCTLLVDLTRVGDDVTEEGSDG